MFDNKIRCLKHRLKVHHLTFVDLINDEVAFQAEKDAFGKHDDNISYLDFHI